MTHDDDLTLRVGEPYFHARSLSREEEEALALLSGVPAYQQIGDDLDEEECLEPEHQLLDFFLQNAVQYAAVPVFNPDGDQSFAHLSSFAEYLLDAMSLMAKADEGQLEEMILAALMAKLRLDEAIYKGKPWQSVWDDRLSEAKSLIERCIRRPANSN